MIRLSRPAEVPEPLRTRGAVARAALEAAHGRAQRDFAFDSSIWGGAAVKDALRRMQHDKCAFCESSFAHIQYGDVEHFRPKAAVAQKAGQPLERPGYYWLAYEWSNLFISCQLCNQRFKRNLFPLSAPARRARDHHADIDREKPLLIDPVQIDPALHLTFHEERAVPLKRRGPGTTTIDVLGLNREELLARRRERLDLLKELREALRLFEARERAGGLAPEELAFLVRLRERRGRYIRPEAEYSAMADAFFRASPTA